MKLWNKKNDKGNPQTADGQKKANALLLSYAAGSADGLLLYHHRFLPPATPLR